MKKLADAYRSWDSHNDMDIDFISPAQGIDRTYCYRRCIGDDPADEAEMVGNEIMHLQGKLVFSNILTT